MQEIADGIEMMDTRLGGLPGVMSAYVVRGPSPALVETGAETSVDTVREALAGAGIGPRDLAWIVLTHVHLDHCGGTGALAAAFPEAAVVVHRRGARHLAEPERLVAGTAAVHGPRMVLYGGLDPTPPERIVSAEDGHRVPVGPGRDLVMMETLGHARHHMSVLDEATGTVLAGDAVGARMGGGGLYPVLPPPDVDIARGVASLDRLAELAPRVLSLAHFGPVPDPDAEIAQARELQLRAAEAAREGWRDGGDEAAVGAALARRLPPEELVGAPGALALWERLGWVENNVPGLTAWAARDGAPG